MSVRYISDRFLPDKAIDLIDEACSKGRLRSFTMPPEVREIEEKLLKKYSNLEIIFNDRKQIGYELDIFIPSLKLAFELNGIYHYEPIYGNFKFRQIQERDANKFQLCHQNNISLCIIDTSSQKYFKEQTSQKFLNIIIKIIDDALQHSATLY